MSSLLGVLSKTQALRHEAYLNLQHQRGMESHSTHNYIEANYATNEFDAVNITTPKEVVQERITKVKENFEQSFQLSNKNTVLNNIKMLRKVFL